MCPVISTLKEALPTKRMPKKSFLNIFLTTFLCFSLLTPSFLLAEEAPEMDSDSAESEAVIVFEPEGIYAPPTAPKAKPQIPKLTVAKKDKPEEKVEEGPKIPNTYVEQFFMKPETRLQTKKSGLSLDIIIGLRADLGNPKLKFQMAKAGSRRLSLERCTM